MSALRRFWCVLTHWHYHDVTSSGMHRYDGFCHKCWREWTESE